MRSKLLFLLTAAVAITASQPASAAVVLDINQTTSIAPYAYLNFDELVFQSFKANVNNNAGVGFWLGSKPGGNITYSLWDSNPVLSGATLLASATVGGGYNAFADAFWATPVSLIVGNTYFISARSDIDKLAQYGSGNPYPDGDVYVGSRKDTKNDLVFRTYTDTTFVAPTTPAVPEPATWAMMLAGFGLIGAAARYRRRSTTLTYS